MYLQISEDETARLIHETGRNSELADRLERRPKVFYGQFTKCLLFTALQLGACAGLYWSDIDFKRKTLLIMRTVAWDYHSRENYFQDLTKNQESMRLLA